MFNFLVYAMLASALAILVNSIPFKDYCTIDKPCTENEICENLKSGYECKKKPEDYCGEAGGGCPKSNRSVRRIKLILDGALATEIYNLIDKIVSGKGVYNGPSNLLSVKLKLINDDINQ